MAVRASADDLPGLDGHSLNQEAFLYYRRLARVQRLVTDHYPEPISLSQAARVAGMEKTSFSDFFHRKTGLCFRDWLAAFRIVKAMQLMARSNQSVQGVGRAVGFENVRTFERVFLRVANCTPVEFKKSVRPS